ncbi:MAG: hypothetical protein HYR91_09205 [Flavobacteriia bacterium]|nr:hypothetical protein [Flavobacteriia bacterium]
MLKKTIHNLTFSNLYISIAAGILVSGMSHLLHYSHVFEIGIFVFSSTICIYTFQRYIKFKFEKTRESELNDWLKNHQYLQLFIILVGGCIAIYFYFFILNAFESTKYWMLLSFILSVLYAVKIKGWNLRDVPYMKIHLIAIVWGKAFLFPVLLNQDFTFSTLLFLGSHYFFFIAICIPFDIRDLHYDNSRMKTIPQLYGVANARIFSLLALFVFIILIFYSNSNLIQNYLFWISVCYTAILVLKVKEDKKPIYYSIFIDGSIILLGTSYFFQ